ncbi:MAG: hypothetical protein J6O54_01470 [Prevotella sp.]|nr:hypothetical protein [Prevotella sp.]MBO6187003.1 hypothetical protein [Prevotella sp.]
MKKVFVTAMLLLAVAVQAQETHYHKALRSQQENDKYGTVGADPNFNGGGGVYWSRYRNVDDVTITRESAADSVARRELFKRLCRQAYDAYDAGDAVQTVQYGDSALMTRYHTPDLYFFMGVSFEKLGSYDEADWAYRKALGAGYPGALNVYKGFQERQKVRKAEDKQRRKEEKRRRKEEKKRLNDNG